MKHITKIILLSFILIITIFQITCRGTSTAQEILNQYRTILCNWQILGEIKHIQANNELVIVSLIKNANSKDKFAEYAVKVVMKKEDDTCKIMEYIIEDFKLNHYKTLDVNEKVIDEGNLSDIDNKSNEKKFIEKVTKKDFVEGRYDLPYLSSKYLGKLEKLNTTNVYINEKLNIKNGVSSIFYFTNPIKATIIINDTSLLEKYQENNKKIFRYLAKVNNLDIKRLKDVITYAKTKTSQIFDVQIVE